jgi:phenylacetic acid degradation operon negative regulatory protein
MNAKTEEFLYLLLWGAETLVRPTFRNLNESYEGWAYRTGLLRQLARLEQRKLIERKPGKIVEHIYRLTETGRLTALGGRDPLALWNRSWDGQWRVVVFDLPERENASRVRLRRFLKDRGFGYLQNSLWITPDPLDKTVRKLATSGQDVESFLTLEARPCSGESDRAIVAGAWDFDQINQRYEECLSVLKKYPTSSQTVAKDTAKLQHWARREWVLWRAAIQGDPLLPSVLLPAGYRGKETWRVRNSVLRKAGRWLE